MMKNLSRVLALALLSALTVVAGPAGPVHADPPAGRPDTILVSAAPDGSPANGMSDRPEISGDGHFITFDSYATNLVSGIPTSERRVYRKDLTTGAIEPVGVSSTGAVTNAWSSFTWPSDDGNLVAFVSDATALTLPRTTTRSVYLRNMSLHTTELISQSSTGVPANGPSSRPMLSGDGRYVAFSSFGSNLTSQGGNGQEQVFVRDRVANTTTLVSVNTAGGPGNARSYRGMVSADGRYVAFASKATNLTAGTNPNAESIFIRDMVAGTTQRVTVKQDGTPAPLGGSRPYMTPDGHYVSFNSYDVLTPNDTNGRSDTFVWDRLTGAMEREGEDGDDGTDPSGDSLRVFLNDDARYSLWNSFANNLVPNDTNPAGDVFLRDRQTGILSLLSLSYYGGPANAQSYRPVMSDDASRIAFLSRARNLVQNDASTDWQVYTMTTASVTAAGLDTTAPTVTPGTPAAGSPVMSTSPVTFSGTISDNRAVDRVAVQIKDNTTGKWMQTDGTWGATAQRLFTTLANRYDFSSSWSWSVNLNPGSYSYNTVGFDVSKNQVTSALIKFTASASTPDTTTPTIAVGSPAANATTTSPLSFSGTADDDRGVDSVSVQIRDNATNLWLRPDGTWGSGPTKLPATLGTPGGTSTTWTYSTALPDGQYYWEAFATDAATNRSNKPSSKVTISSLGPDTTPASATVASPAASSSVTSPVLFSGSATDDRGVVRVFLQVRDNATGLWLRPDGSWGSGAVRLDATLTSPGGTSTDWSYTASLPAGSYGFDVTALDAANNTPVKPWTKFSVTG